MSDCISERPMVACALVSVRTLLEVSGLDRRLWARAKRYCKIPTIRVGNREYVSYAALQRWVGATLAQWLCAMAHQPRR
jgi:hypothetical protein